MVTIISRHYKKIFGVTINHFSTSGKEVNMKNLNLKVI
jgi:hypothetical protein